MSSSSKEIRSVDPYFNGQWIRKASTWETIMETGHRNGNFLIWYQLNLKSKSPLQEYEVRRAVNHLYRKVPSLGVCLDNKDSELWLKRASNPEIDFKVLRGQKVDEVRECLRKYLYNSNTGPLFCARLLQESPDAVDDKEDLDPDFHFNSYFFFGTHHGITDGTSNMYIMGFFISLLNDIISNKPINDNEMMGTFATEEETLKIIEKKKELIESDPKLKETIAREREINKEAPLIISGFQPSKDKMRTVSVIKILDRNTTSRFVQKCRQENCTVNSSFAALVNIALVDLLVENGVIQDSYRLQNFHLVNMRRYWNVKIPFALGCHIGGPLTVYTDTPRNLENKFWNYVRSLHQVLKDDIESARVLLDKAFNAITCPGYLPYSEEFLHSEKDYEGDYVTSNMGNVTPLVTEGGEHVRVTHVFRSSTIHMIENPICINLHTFRGKFTMIFDYNAGIIRKDIAEKFCSQIIKRIMGILE